MTRTLFAAGVAALALAVPAAAQNVRAQEARTTESGGTIAPVSGFTGEMSMTMETEMPEDMAVTETIRFEPWQMLGDMFRDDVVFLMRGGPTDWGQEDDPAAGPMDCENQRLLTETGDDVMRQFGALLVANELRPGKILVSEWCRTQQTYAAMERGMLGTDMNAIDGMQVDVDPALSLLGAENGPSDVEGLRELVLNWDGGEEDGPLMLITHFTNIFELTEFSLYEGEFLILDPDRDGRVLGYVRLRSAAPDSVRFDPSVVSATLDLVADDAPPTATD